MTILLFMILLLHPMALNFSIENDFNVLRNLIANESYEDAKNMIQQNKGVTNYSPYEDDSSPLSIAIEKGKVNLVQDMLIKSKICLLKKFLLINFCTQVMAVLSVMPSL